VVIFGLCGIGCALSWDFYSLLVFRFIQGIGMGAEVPVAASYINEIAPAKQRGRFVLLYEFIFAVGVLAAGLIGRWTIPAFGWQSIFWIGAVPALLIVPFIAYLPESPRWLIGRGRIDEAEKVVTRIEQEITRAGHTLPPAKDAIPSIVAKGTLRELLSDRYRKRTIVMWLIWICIGFISWPLTTWLPTMFRTVYQLPVDTALTYGLITTSGAIVAGTLTCSLLIDIVGRRRWFTMAFGIAALAMVTVWISGAQPVLLVVALAAVTMFFIASMNLAIYVYTPENYPTRLRTMGMGICSAWSRIAGMISPVVIGWWLAAEGMAAVFLLLGAFGVIGALVTFLFAEESRWKPLEELSP
jgi:MFS transporter, putative metabolite:H+ symporter